MPSKRKPEQQLAQLWPAKQQRITHQTRVPSAKIQVRGRLPLELYQHVASYADQNTLVALSSAASWMRAALRPRVFNRIVINSYRKLAAFNSRWINSNRMRFAHNDEEFQHLVIDLDDPYTVLEMSPHEHAKQILFAFDHPSVWKSVSVSIDSLNWDDQEMQKKVLRESCSINTEELQIADFDLAHEIVSSCNLEHLKDVTVTACFSRTLVEKVYKHCTNLESLRVKSCPCKSELHESYVDTLGNIAAHRAKLKRLYYDVPIELTFWEFTSRPAGVPVMGQIDRALELVTRLKKLKVLRLAFRVSQRQAPENSGQCQYALQSKEPPTLNYFNNFSIGIMQRLEGVEMLQVCYETHVPFRDWRIQDTVTRVVDNGSPSRTESFHTFSEKLVPDQIHSDARNMYGDLQSAKKSVEGFGYAHRLWSQRDVRFFVAEQKHQTHLYQHMKNVLPIGEAWNYIYGGFETQDRPANVTPQKRSSNIEASRHSALVETDWIRLSWTITQLDISDLDADATVILSGCVANTLLSLAVNDKQLLRLMNAEGENKMVLQNKLLRLVLGSGTRAEDAIDAETACAMFQFIKCAFPRASNIFFNPSIKIMHVQRERERFFKAAAAMQELSHLEMFVGVWGDERGEIHETTEKLVGEAQKKFLPHAYDVRIQYRHFES